MLYTQDLVWKEKKIIVSRDSSGKDGISAGLTESLGQLDLDINIIIIT